MDASLITAIKETPIPIILVLAGLLFILLSFVTKLGGFIEVSAERKRQAVPVGLLVLAIGLVLKFVDPGSTANVFASGPSGAPTTPQPNPQSIPQPIQQPVPQSAPQPAPQASVASEQVFLAPMYAGYRLDACYQWADQCGEPAATAWCKSNGFDHANDFPTEDVGTHGIATKLIGTQQVCKAAFCASFAHIRCVR